MAMLRYAALPTKRSQSGPYTIEISAGTSGIRLRSPQ